MSAIDYSKWDRFQVSSDEEMFGNPIPPQSQPITAGPLAAGHAGIRKYDAKWQERRRFFRSSCDSIRAPPRRLCGAGFAT